jgi:hypothetical protein
VTLFNLASRYLRPTTFAAGILALAVLSGPFARTNKHAGGALPHMENWMALYGAEAATIDRTARDYRLPDQFEWKDGPGNNSKTAALFGDPSKAGLFVQVIKRGPNIWSQPHSHPNERFITVLAGTFLIGTGSKFDKNNTVAIGPGGVVHDIPNQMHYDGTGPEGATLEFIAMGPATRN